MKALLITALLICQSTSLADNVKVLKKGESAPFDGVLFNKEMEKSIRQIDLDNDFLKRQNVSLKRLNELSEQENTIITRRYENMQVKANELSEKQIKMENRSFLQNSIYFLGGALITGFITYGVARAVK